MSRPAGRFGAAVTAFVAVAAGLALAVGLAVGLELGTAVLLGLIVLLGALAVAVARKADRGAVAPARCAECDGLMSPHAPYCKHCGTRRNREARDPVDREGAP